MTYHADWTSCHVGPWAEHLKHLAGKPNVRALEIGVLEGRSTVWFLENVLKGDGSTITCVDPFIHTQTNNVMVMKRNDAAVVNEARARFLENVAPFGDKVVTHEAYSIDWFATLPKPLPENVYDFAYIDGSHALVDVAIDLFATWRMMKPGGVIIADDYGKSESIEIDGGEVIHFGVTEAANALVAATKCDVLYAGRQLIVRKK